VPLVISDDILKQTGLSERELAIEIACRLYDSGMLHMPQATRLAGVSRHEFESACLDRRIKLYRYSAEMIEEDIQAAHELEARRAGRL
jgi:predicted HTH domain antitoxin